MIHKLPVEAYTSQEWFDREQKQIFSTTWRYAGFVEDITEQGQYISVQAGLNNLFVVMGSDGQLRAFHNLCRHRGTQLLRAVGKTETAITCPYHDWTYDLAGNLTSIPDEEQEFGKVDKSCLGLKSASVGIWRGMLFVHPDPDAPRVDEWFNEVEPHLGPHDIGNLVEYPKARTEYEVQANWKIVVENYIDVYHLSHLHSGTLGMYDHAQAEYGFHGPHYAFREPLSADYAAELERNSPMPLILPSEQAAAYVPMLFPGIGLAESESNWATFILTPISPELTRVENRVRVADVSDWEFAKQEWRSAAFWGKQISGKYSPSTNDQEDDPMSSGDFTSEDIYACEQAQKSMKSPYMEVGPAAKGESPVLQHQQIVLDYLKAPTPPSQTKVVRSEEIPTEPLAPASTVQGVPCNAEITLAGKKHIISVAADQTILQAAREANLDPPFACQAGVCGTCRAHLVSGTTEQASTAALSEKEVNEGIILTCQARPTTETIAITYPAD